MPWALKLMGPVFSQNGPSSSFVVRRRQSYWGCQISGLGGFPQFKEG
jgi:hypothetical protein